MSIVTELALSPATDDDALTAHDRCDKCGSQAMVRTVLRNGFDLLFCGHHSREFAAALAAVALHDVEDFS